MAHEVLMPKLSSTMDEGTITVWLKNEGDEIAVGDAIFEVMTDKIAIEVEAYDEGILLKKYIQDGESAPVNSVIAYIGEADESVPEAIIQQNKKTSEKETDGTSSVVETKEVVELSQEIKNQNIRATPAARRVAYENQVDLKKILGSGPRGRIQLRDVNAAIESANQISEYPENNSSSLSANEGILIPWSGMRKIIAENMVASKQTAPHVTMNAQVDCGELVNLRSDLLPLVEEQTQERLSYLEIISKAVTIALRSYPMFNSHATDEGIYQYHSVNLGIAVALDEGLIVPVVHHAEQKGLSELTKEVKKVTREARLGQLSSQSLSGGTFTISSLGRSRVRTFSPIIHLPESAILGVGGMYQVEKPTVVEGELMMKEYPMMDLSLSFDHRVADGAPAAEFLSLIVEMLENPKRLLL